MRARTLPNETLTRLWHAYQCHRALEAAHLTGDSSVGNAMRVFNARKAAQLKTRWGLNWWSAVWWYARRHRRALIVDHDRTNCRKACGVTRMRTLYRHKRRRRW